MQMEKTYIAIDLKTFYASVECVERGLDPLTTNLVVADKERTEKTICLAVTQSLKAYGLSGRSRLFEVFQKAKEIKALTGKPLNYIIAPPRMALYIKYSSNIYEIYLQYFSPEDIHVYSIDEVFIDITQYLHLYKTDAKTLTRKVIQNILSSTGITATAGIGTNLFLCKVAMDIVAKHLPADNFGVRIAYLNKMLFRHTLWNHKPLTDFWRIGPGITKRLHKNGMFTLGDVARRSLSERGEKELYKLFGIDAEILIDHAWGHEPCTMKNIKSYKSKKTSLSSGQVLHCPYTFEKARLVLKEMTEMLVLDLVEKNFITSSVTLSIGYDISNVKASNFTMDLCKDFYGRLIPKPAHGTVAFYVATSSTDIIMNGILQLFEKIVDSRLLIRKINLCANNLSKKSNQELDLFYDLSIESKEKSLQKSVLEIQKKFGKNAVLKANSYEEGATSKDRNLQIGGHRA
ncbi:MAG: DNA methylase [Treponema sp.]|nr:DNA methylase [Treponema sp.]